ncbi:MAG: class I SAM-dependent methyltransferase [Coriobacteriales bacterium]|nr:class I SAM-dependent methyltransferase [Coriobacteriales bacterium]
MDIKLARRLSGLTSDFYRHVGDSFSTTRQHGWPGWQRVLEVTGLEQWACAEPLTVLDLACGNRRFARYLCEQGIYADVWGVDNCDDLARSERVLQDGCSLGHYQHLDIMDTLFEGRDLARGISAPPCDLAVCFGFMHHIPLPEQRARILEALLAHTKPEGYVALTFWAFARNERMLAKATPVTCGNEGDYLLGWQGRSDVQRYCHSFQESEIDDLVQGLGSRVREAARFWADGRTGDLNRYLILQLLAS